MRYSAPLTNIHNRIHFSARIGRLRRRCCCVRHHDGTDPWIKCYAAHKCIVNNKFSIKFKYDDFFYISRTLLKPLPYCG